MAHKVKREKSDNSSYQRASLINSSPNRDMKAYDVSYYRWRSLPGRIESVKRDSYSSEWFNLTGADNRAAEPYIGRFDVEQQQFFYQPLGVHYASEVDRIADAKLRHRISKAKDEGLNAAVALAELGQTMRMFANTAIRVNRSMRALRRRNYHEAWSALGMSYAPPGKGESGNSLLPSRVRVDDRSVTGRSSNLLLEYTYGFVPLMHDIDAAAHKLSERYVSRPPVIVQRVRHSKSERSESVNNGVTLKSYTELSIAKTLHYRVSNDFISHAASLGFTNPMLLVWETIPLSFVLDWFVNVGDWLQGFSAYHGLEFLAGCSSASGRNEQSALVNGSVSTSYVTYSPSYGVYELHPGQITTVSASYCESKSSGFTRTLSMGFPGLPPLEWKLPDSNLGSKFASSLALLRQRRSSLGPLDKVFA